MAIGALFKSCFGCMPQRYVMGLMAFWGIAMAYILRNCLAMAIVDMASKKKEGGKNATDMCPNIKAIKHEVKKKGSVSYDWDEKKQSQLLGCFFYGYVVSHIPGGLASDIFGAKHVFGGGVFVSAICSLVTPFAASINYYFAFTVRIVMGIAQGVLFPAANVLLARWVPPAERATMGSVVLAATQIGNVLCNTISGLIMANVSWVWVFYVWGICGIIWYAIFCVSVYSEPASHPFISEGEMEYLNQALAGVTARKDVPPLPVCRILLSVPVWALIICQLGHNWGLFGIQNYYPKYMKAVLKYSAAKNGIFTSLPYLGMWLVAIGSGVLIDWIIKKEIMSRLTTRRIFALISQVAPGFGCVLAVYAGCNRAASIAIFTIGMSLMGPFWPSMKVNALDLSPNYAGFLMALVNGIGAAAGFLNTTAYGLLMKDDMTLGGWRLIFWISNAIISISGVIYVIFMQAEIQSWNDTRAAAAT